MKVKIQPKRNMQELELAINTYRELLVKRLIPRLDDFLPDVKECDTYIGINEAAEQALALLKATEETELYIVGVSLMSLQEAKTLFLPEELAYKERWWLGSPGYLPYYAAFVSKEGFLCDCGDDVDDNAYAVRPVLKIAYPTSSRPQNGDMFMFKGKKFKFIARNMAFCMEDIGRLCFRKDAAAQNANVYQMSDIKEYVDNWFKGGSNENGN